MTEFDFSTEKKPPLSQVIEKLGEVSTLPQVLQRILQVTSDPNAGASDLQDILRVDPALTAKILKVANSAYYGLSQKVVDMKKAVVFLGFKTVKNLAVAASVCDLFKSEENINDYSRKELWKHSVVVAICAKSIALRAGLKISEEVFTAAIMHDIGIVMEDQFFNKDFARVLQDPRLETEGMPFVEKEVFGFDHAQLGERVAEHWKIPKEISRIIASHHQPRSAPEDHTLQAAIVFLANVICNAKKAGYAVRQKINREDIDFVLKHLNFEKDDVAVIVEEMNSEISMAKDLFII